MADRRRLVACLIALGVLALPGSAPAAAPPPTAPPPTARVRCRTSTSRARTASAPRATRRSKVWFTVADGVLSDVYFPTNDNTNNETLQYVVTDGTTFTDLQTRDMTYTVAGARRPRADAAASRRRPRAGATGSSPTT